MENISLNDLFYIVKNLHFSGKINKPINISTHPNIQKIDKL